MKPYPAELTTSDWVDYLVGLSREDQIAALATYHRRIEHGAKVVALSNLADPDPAAHETVTAVAKIAIEALPAPVDYDAN